MNQYSPRPEKLKQNSAELLMNGERRIHETELVSVGVPVRNGGLTLRYALDSILNQDHRNLEVIISDNDSSDTTAAIALEYQERDERIIYHRQPRFLTALDNFKFALEEARGRYFMWASHDDTRSINYVSSLLRAMQADPQVVLSFGDLYVSGSIENEGELALHDFDTTALTAISRMRKAASPACCHFYGLWRKDALRRIPLNNCVWSPDQPIMPAAAYLGEFRYVSGPIFTYVEIKKSSMERAIYQDGKVGFNKYAEMVQFLVVTYKASAAVGGAFIGIAAVFLVSRAHAKNLPSYIGRKLRTAFSQRGGSRDG